jgi:hypothetical protein
LQPLLKVVGKRPSENCCLDPSPFCSDNNPAQIPIVSDSGDSKWNCGPATTCTLPAGRDSRALVEPLEPRVLYSADVWSGLTGVVADPLEDSTDTGIIPTLHDDAPVELAFINSDIENRDTLLADLYAQQLQGRALEIYLLDDASHGLDQIEQILGLHESVSQVHVLSHGNGNGIQLGGSWLDLAEVEAAAAQVASWRSHLTTDASWLLYGCDLAADESGIALVDRLAELTGAQVFASSDATGHATLHADWTLEYHSGDDEEYELLLSEVAQTAWVGTLAAPSLGDGTLADINEDLPLLPGDTIANIFSGQFSAADGRGFAGIAVAGDATTIEGVWEYSADSGSSWVAVENVAADAALLLDVNTLLRFVPAANVNGVVPALTLYGIDDSYAGTFSDNTTPAIIDVTTRGGATPLAADAATIHSFIHPVNDAPLLGDGALTDIVVNAPSPIGASIADIFSEEFYDDDADAVFSGVAVAGDSTDAEGQWQYSTDDGSQWFPVDSVSISDALLLDSSSRLRFVPSADFIGNVPLLTLYAVDDTGGPFTAGGSKVTDSVASRGGALSYAAGESTIRTSVVADFTANSDDLGSVRSGSSHVFSPDVLTDNDAIIGTSAPQVLRVTPPDQGALSDNGADFEFLSDVGDSYQAQFDYIALDGTPNLISQWQLTEDGADEAGINHGLVVTDSAPGSLVFDGDDYVEVPNFSYPSEFTLAFSFRVNSLDNDNEEVLIAQGEYQKKNSLVVWITGNEADSKRTLTTDFWDSKSKKAGYKGFEFDITDFEDDGLWHHYAIVVKEGVGSSIYIDGDLKNTSARGENPFTPDDPLYVGAEDEDDGDLDYFLINHEIRDLRFYEGVDLALDVATATITVRNEEVLVTNTGVEVNEDQTLTITSAELRTTDFEEGPADLVYEIVTDAAYGKLVLNGNDLSVASRFTQLDIDSGLLAFRHNGSETATADNILLRVDDGAGTHTEFVLPVTLNALNDQPVLSDLESDVLEYREGDGAKAVSRTIVVSDADDSTLSEATVVISTGYQAGEDELLFSNTPAITGTFDNGTLMLAGSADHASWQAALRSVQYRNTSEQPENSEREVSISVGDGDALSATVVRKVDVSGVNDAPAMGNAILASIDEDEPDPAGQTVAALFDSVFSDIDGDLGGLAVTGGASGLQGDWQYSTDAGASWFDIGDVSVDSALLISATTLVRFLPADGFFGEVPSLTLHGVDDSFAESYTDGIDQTRRNVSITGGDSPFTADASIIESFVNPIGPTDLIHGIEFNTDGGNDAYLLVDDGSVLLGGLDALTAEVQFEIETPNSKNTLFSYRDSVNDQFKLVVRSGGEIDVAVMDSTVRSMPVPELLDGQRHSVSVTWDASGGYLRLYADGRLIQTFTDIATGQSLPPGGTLTMVMEQDSLNGDFEHEEVLSGTLYDARLWSEARTGAEIKSQYQHQFYVDSLPQTLIANWQMDGVGAEGVIADVVGGNNLTISHATGAGFSTSTPVARLQVAEDAPVGTVIGSLQSSFPYWGEDLIRDGSFTTSVDTSITTYAAGSTIGGAAGHWQVRSGTVDVVPTWDASPGGGVPLDLVGSTNGSVTQSVVTEPGKSYRLNFALSGDFNHTDQQTAQVMFDDGTSISSHMVSANKPPNWSNTNLLWDSRSVSFVAASAAYDISFVAVTSANTGGALISDVSLMEVNPAIEAVLADNPGLMYDENTSKFYLVNSTETDWVTAQNDAAARIINGVSGRLVTIHSAYENSVVQSIAATNNINPFLGATDQTSEGQWYWHNGVDDDALLWSGGTGGSAPDGVYTNWKTSEPNNINGEHYAVMYWQEGDGVWNDARFDSVYGSIIEWDAETVLSQVRYSIESDPDGAFAIDPLTGELRVVDISGIDSESNPSYEIGVRVTDATDESFDKPITVFIADNSAPQLAGIESDTLNYSENSGPAVITSTLTTSDADDSSLESATVSAPGLSANERLVFNDYGPFTSTRDTGSGELTITGTASVAAWQSALRTVAYENTSDDPTPGSISIYFQVSDGSESSNVGERVLNIIAENDAPMLTDSVLPGVEEGDAAPDGHQVGDVFEPQFTDVDGQLFGVAVVQDATTMEGVWEFSVDGGLDWHSVGSVSESSALLLQSSDLLRFLPTGDYHGPVPALSVVGVDDSLPLDRWTTIDVRLLGDVTVRGGSTAYSADIAAVDSVVSAVGPTDFSGGVQLNANGNSAYLVADNGADLLGGLSALTVEALVTLDTVSGATPLLSYATAAVNNALMLEVQSDGSLVAYVGDHRLDAPDELSLAPDGTPRAIAFTWESTNGAAAFYIDGQLIHREYGLATGEVIASGGVLVFGQEQDPVSGEFDPTQVFEGTYHDIRLWNEARTSAEVAQSYRHKFSLDLRPPALIANWQMDEFNNGGDITDVVGGGTLSVDRATGNGFIAGTASDELSVTEHALAGTIVGALVPYANYSVEDLIADGLFTDAGATGSDLYNAGDTLGAGGAWLVETGQVNLQGGWSASPLGGVPLDLSGDVPGAVSQTIATEIGEVYQVHFALTGNFDELSDKAMTVTAGAASDSYSITPVAGWNSAGALMWSQRTFTFTATTDTTTLTFIADSPNTQYGPVISDVQVVKLPEAVATLLAQDTDLQYNPGTGKFYKPVSTATGATDAREAAIDLTLNGVSGQLATVISPYENTVLHSIAKRMDDDIWLGASDSESDGHWYWMQGNTQNTQFWDGVGSGSRVDGAYVNWATGEPGSNAASQDYLILNKSNGSWDDQDASASFSYVVEWRADEVISAHMFALLSDDSGAFVIDQLSGVIRVADGTLLDYETNAMHQLEVQVTDLYGETYSEVVSVAVKNARAPVIFDTAAAALTYTEGELPLAIADAIGVDDQDDLYLQAADFSITSGYQAGQDELVFTNTATLTGFWDSGNGVLTVSGEDTVEAWQAALRTVAYQNQSADPVTDDRYIEISVSDGREWSNTLSRTLSVLAINNAPAIAGATLSDVAEDSDTHSGEGIGDLLGSGFSDPDGSVIAIAVVHDASASEGTWQYSTDGGALWYPVGEVTESGALVLSTDTLLRFLPGANYHGAVPTLSVIAVDDSSTRTVTVNDSRSIADVSTRGGDTAFSLDAAIIDGAITPVNDVPVIAGASGTEISYLHRSPAVFVVPGIDVTDIDNSQLAGAQIQLTNFEAGVDRVSVTVSGGLSQDWNASTGLLTLSGTADKTVYRDVLQTLVYESDSAPAAGPLSTRGISLFVIDQMGEASAPASMTVRLEVPPFPITLSNPGLAVPSLIENEAPVAFANQVLVNSLDSRNISEAVITVDNYHPDEDKLLFNNTVAISGAWDNDTGILRLSGDAPDSVWQQAIREIRYENRSENPVTDTRSVSMTLQSSSGDSTPLSLEVPVIAVNDAPLAASVEKTFSADAPFIFTADDFGFSDPAEADTLLAVRFEQVPVAGQLMYGETSIGAGDEITASDIATGRLQYVPPNVSDTLFESLEFRVRDSGGSEQGGHDLSDAAYLFALTVTPGTTQSGPETGQALPFTVAENAAAGTLIGNLSDLDQPALFVHQRDGDFAEATRLQVDFNRYAADGSHLGSSLGEWQVSAGNVDLRGASWAAAPDGGIALDLNGNSPGQISQQITTVPGAQYQVSFHLSGNFRDVSTEAAVQVAVSAAAVTEEYRFEYVPDWSQTNLQWTAESMTFTAVDPVTTITFSSLTPGSYGPLIADIEVLDVLEYQLTDQSLPFHIAGDALQAGGSLDYETQSGYTVDIRLNSSAGTSSVMSVPIELLDVNEAPVLSVNETLPVVAGTETAIGSAFLLATDVDESDADATALHYTLVSLPVSGELRLDGAVLAAGQAFTQADLLLSRLTYAHNGIDTSPDTFGFNLSDGGEDGVSGFNGQFNIDVHAPLSFSIAEVWSLHEGESVTLSDDHLLRTGGLMQSSDLQAEVVSVSEGFTLLDAHTATPVSKFTVHDLTTGGVRLAHDGSNIHSGELQLRIVLADDERPVADTTIVLSAIDVADAPGGGNSARQTDHATPVVVTATELAFTDSDDGDSFAGIKIVSLPDTGRLQAAGVDVVIGDLVDAQLIEEGLLQYQPDTELVGSITESIGFHVVDTGDLSTGGVNVSQEVFKIDITVVSDHKPTARDDSAIVNEGGTITSLSSGSLSVIDNDSDPDTDSSDLLVELDSEPLHGSLQLYRDGSFVYVHDGSETISDRFSYRVIDSDTELGRLLAGVGMVEIEIVPGNDSPEAGRTEDRTVSANEPVSFRLPNNLFTDIDSNDELTLTASMADGSALPAWLEFNASSGEFTGLPDDAQTGTFRIVVTATDSAGASAQTEFEIEVEPQIGAAVSQAVATFTAVNHSNNEVADTFKPVTRQALTREPSERPEIQQSGGESQPAANESLFKSLLTNQRAVDAETQAQVVKHSQQRSVVSSVADSFIEQVVFDDAVVELEQLFFIADDNPLRLSKAIQQELNRVNGELTRTFSKEDLAVGGTISLSAGLSIGYVIWLVRGGLLMSSVLASMPAWRIIDPIPVLEDQNGQGDEADNETLETMTSSPGSAQDCDGGAEDSALHENHDIHNRPRTDWQ